MVACSIPNPNLGVAIRIADYLDCQARTLGENGFQAVAAGPLAGGLLSGVITIFVALIGYRLLLGGTPDFRDGIGWAVRLGVVLALTTGWPAFQTLVYQVAVDSPVEIAGILLPAAGLPSESLDDRIQAAYDTIRLGTLNQSPSVVVASPSVEPGATVPIAPLANSLLGQAPRPQTASLFVVATMGFMAALRLAAGLLLALAPFALLSILFNATLGIFNGWVRALTGTALALVAATVVAALHLVAMESELANLEAVSLGTSTSGAVDAQGLTTIAMIFTIIMLVAIWAAIRMAGAFRIDLARHVHVQETSERSGTALTLAYPGINTQQTNAFAKTLPSGQERVQSVADALAASVRRDQFATSTTSGVTDAPTRRVTMANTAQGDTDMVVVPIGATGRRSTNRRTRSAVRRDQKA